MCLAPAVASVGRPPPPPPALAAASLARTAAEMPGFAADRSSRTAPAIASRPPSVDTRNATVPGAPVRSRSARVLRAAGCWSSKEMQDQPHATEFLRLGGQQGGLPDLAVAPHVAADERVVQLRGRQDRHDEVSILTEHVSSRIVPPESGVQLG